MGEKKVKLYCYLLKEKKGGKKQEKGKNKENKDEFPGGVDSFLKLEMWKHLYSRSIKVL